jgi:hypothetical protein
MAVTYSTAAKTARMEAINDLVPAGKIKIYTTGQGTLLATFTMPNPAGTTASGVWTIDMDPDLSTTGAADGTAAVATITDSSDTEVITGLTVGTGSEDIVLDNASITTGQTVTLATGTITHA